MQVQLQVVQSHNYDAQGSLIHHKLLEQYTKKAKAYSNFVGQESSLTTNIHAHFDVVLEAIAAARVELIRLHRLGDIDEHTMVELGKNLDLDELNAIAVRS